MGHPNKKHRPVRLTLTLWTSALLLLLAVPAFAAETKECGWSIRWDVKTLSDKDAAKIDFRPVRTTVRRLTRMKRAYPKLDQPRMAPEYRVYEVVCRIRHYSVAEDGDLNLILADPKNPKDTMIAELPDPDCVRSQGSRYKEEFRRAWKEFRENCAINGKVVADGDNHRVRKGLYRVTGVAFFDVPHFQEGVAHNDIELHPVLSIERAGG